MTATLPAIRRTAQPGITLIKSFESCQLKAYRDTRGVLTIGWGHTGHDVYPGLVCSQDTADRAFIVNLGIAERAIADLITAPLNQNQFDALAAFTYNVGRSNLYISTLRTMLNLLNYVGAQAQFARWNKETNPKTLLLEVVPGLTRRRTAEASLFATPTTLET